ncbi:hypothetical protein OB236_01630 [Paenibacillus sp. WQ 127069]|uniref:Secreted protein n=1 Tax=Paenibacillus baimaensis TaxID=2982185 RepID=A0ABT2U869_9BACL|nr:hypothetical protein [Paenibacillus sp. WQ 127069]MCU6790816.1 hypothetical protein [Paenibacillus sp. WQ 127069]
MTRLTLNVQSFAIYLLQTSVCITHTDSSPKVGGAVEYLQPRLLIHSHAVIDDRYLHVLDMLDNLEPHRSALGAH